MVPRPEPLTRQTARLQALLAVAFSQRRKMIRNTLGKWLRGRTIPAFDLAAAGRTREPRRCGSVQPVRRRGRADRR